MTGEMQRDLGRAEGRLSALETNIREIKESQEAQGERLGNIERMLSEAKGGWKAFLMVGGIAGTMGALVTKIVPFLSSLR